MKTDAPPPLCRLPNAGRTFPMHRPISGTTSCRRRQPTLQHRHRRRGNRPPRHQLTRRALAFETCVLICMCPVSSAALESNECNESIVKQLEAIDQRLGRNNAPNRRPTVAVASDNVNLSTEIADERSSRTFSTL